MSVDTMEQQELFPEQTEDQRLGEAVQKVREKYHGVSIIISKGAQTRKVSGVNEETLNTLFGSDKDSVTLTKRLFSRKMVKRVPELRKLSEVLGSINRLKVDRRYTLPHPEPGVRLLRRGDENFDVTSRFVQEFEDLKQQLREATADLAQKWDDVKRAAQEVQGNLYNPEDYAYNPTKSFDVRLSFRYVDIPPYLENNEKLKQQVMEQIEGEYREAIQIAESLATEEIFNMVDSLVERLEDRRLLDKTHEVVSSKPRGSSDEFEVTYIDKSDKTGGSRGTRKTMVLSSADFSSRVAKDTAKKTFRNDTVEKLLEAVRHVKSQNQELGIGSENLMQALDRITQVVGKDNLGNTLKQLRNNEVTRQDVRRQLQQVGSHLLDSVVDKPRRTILRNAARARRNQD